MKVGILLRFNTADIVEDFVVQDKVKFKTPQLKWFLF